ncbi:aminopeptidase y [Diplodia corticola]|uniref:Aminopeptidase y n=1 Tax=Diplodia corticola TaxID=236234 RepID=A0A1J9QID7_9PEZI|nr:aminopeptidase y [Diplodia corticola]OJD28614.1 aminopeptidase y [Diplodia corticola]
MRFLESSAVLAAAAVVGKASASTPAGHVHAVRPASLLQRRVPQTFPQDWQPDVENWGAAPEQPNEITVQAASEAKTLVTSDALQNDIDSAALLAHAENLQAIAYQTTGRNRVFGSEGHNFTTKYLYDLIAELDEYYDVQYQPFVETFSGGDATFTINGEDQGAALMTYAPNGQVEAPVVAVSNLGCEPSDFPAEVSGAIALISRGTCDFGLKAAYAGAAGAAGAVIYNNIEGTLSGTLSVPNRTEGPYPPTAAISLSAGQAILSLLEAGEVTGDLNVNSIIEDRVT